MKPVKLLFIDSNLNFDKNLQTICKKASYKLTPLAPAIISGNSLKTKCYFELEVVSTRQ